MAFGLLRGGVGLGFLALAERERESEREIIAEMRDGQMHCLSSGSMIAFYGMESSSTDPEDQNTQASLQGLPLH